MPEARSAAGRAGGAARPPHVHLHVASAYSMRYGVAHPHALAQRAAEQGMDLLAVTDRDGLYGAVKHVQACREAGIRPIIGADLPLTCGVSGSEGALQARHAASQRFRGVALAAPGSWGALCRLVTSAHQREAGGGVSADYSGLVVLLGPESDVGRALAERRPELAARRLAAWREVAEVAVEVVDHLDRGQVYQAGRMLALAGEAGVPAVLTNAVRYLDPADSPVAQVLDVSRKLVPLYRRHLEDRTGHAYLKSGAQMARIAERICGPDRDAAAELLAATRRLAERCALEPGRDLGMDRVHLPEAAGSGIGPDAAPGAGSDAGTFAELVARCEAGLARRGLDRSAAARDRLEHELAIIRRHRWRRGGLGAHLGERTNLAAFFLVVADAAELVRAAGIRCAIRGSGAGSLVNYLLGIGDVNPLEHDLVMERFLSDSRLGLPDIDLDVESARRLEAYRMIFERYGAERVACVSMMETYRARSAIRDVGNAVGLPPYEIDAIAKAFPHVRAKQIRAALADLPELRQSNLGQRQLAGLFRVAEGLDGLPRHIAMHPCGLVLSDAGLRDRTPVEASALGFPMSQYDKDDVEAMGLLKLDVIGVRMQSAMAHAVAEAARVAGGGAPVDLAEIPRDDEPTYEMIRTARTLGCFQIESPGQRELVGKLAPRDMDDLVIDISLFRPGPVNSDMVTPYLDARHGRRPATYPHRDLAGALRESRGVVVYHEQVLRVLDTMTGCGMSAAEAARRRLGSPDEADQAELAGWFRDRALARGYDRGTVLRVWEMLGAFGAFGFCKAHAASFALPTYQSAWLKRHHTAAFYAGVLTHDPGMYPKRAILDDARRFGIPILPLDVNRSAAGWRVEPAPGSAELGIRVALDEVRGITEAEVDRIVAGRPYHSLADLWWRGRPSRPIAERLVLAGAFDPLYGTGPWTPGAGMSRRDLLCQVGALDRAAGRRGTATPGQLPLGDDGGSPLGIVEEIPPGELPEMTSAEAVEAELDILGMDVSRHALSFYDEFLAELGVVRSRDLLGHRAGGEVLVAGVKVATQTPAVRSGQRVIFATVDDATGLVDATFFESVQGRCAATVFGSWLMVIRGRIRRPGGRAISLNATDCWDLAGLYETWRRGGMAAVAGRLARPAAGGGAHRGRGRRLVYANGYELSPYADIGPAGGAVKRPPRTLWHASGGSSGAGPGAGPGGRDP